MDPKKLYVYLSNNSSTVVLIENNCGYLIDIYIIVNKAEILKILFRTHTENQLIYQN